MEQVVLEAARREATGKGAARAARREGLVPGVVYGMGREPLAVTVDRDALLKAMKRGGSHALFQLKIAGMEAPTGAAAIVKDLQIHPVSRQPESVDFQWVSMLDKIEVTVPIAVQGEAQGVVDGGVLETVLHEVTVSCLPTAIPDQLVVNVDGLGIHESRKVCDLQVPEGVTVVTDPEATVVTCVPPTTAEPELEAAETAPVEGEVTRIAEAE